MAPNCSYSTMFPRRLGGSARGVAAAARSAPEAVGPTSSGEPIIVQLPTASTQAPRATIR